MTAPMSDPLRIRHEELEAWAAAVLEGAGVPVPQARTAARLIVRSDMRGRETHGIARLASYVQMVEEGLCNPRPEMRHDEHGGALVFDADGALGHVAAAEIVGLGLAALRRQATVLVVARDIGHLGALGMHALAAAEGGAACLVGQYGPPILAMPGFTRAAIGNNPLAFACPLPNGDPLVFDMACSAVARGNVLLAAREGRPIPEGWALDETGAPTTDAQRALRGAMLPAGDHKGMGIAMMIEVLAGALSATAESLQRPRATARQGGGAHHVGAFFWFIDPAAFGSREAFDGYMAQWTGYYVASAPGDGRLPGQQGAALERRAAEQGIEIAPAIVRELRELGARLGVAFPIAPAQQGSASNP